MSISRFFRTQIQVARVLGIPVRIDYRWFVIFALSTWVIAASFEQGSVITQFARTAVSRPAAGAAIAIWSLLFLGLFAAQFVRGHWAF